MSSAMPKAEQSAGTPTFQAINPGTSQKKAFTATTGQSSAVAAGTSLVRLCATQNCHIAIGANPTAVADGTGLYLPSGVVEYVGITGGHKIAVIRDTADGNLFITEGA